MKRHAAETGVDAGISVNLRVNLRASEIVNVIASTSTSALAAGTVVDARFGRSARIRAHACVSVSAGGSTANRSNNRRRLAAFWKGGPWY